MMLFLFFFALFFLLRVAAVFRRPRRTRRPAPAAAVAPPPAPAPLALAGGASGAGARSLLLVLAGAAAGSWLTRAAAPGAAVVGGARAPVLAARFAAEPGGAAPAAAAPAAAPAAEAPAGGYAQPPARALQWFDAAALAGAFSETPLVEGALAPREARADRWVVVTTINAPTEAVARLAALPGWRVVVVGDTKTPRDWAWPNVTYLSLDAQRALGLSTEPLLATRAYTRKNVGYLYAALHGAATVYETDDDNALTARDVPLLPLGADGAAELLELAGTGASFLNHHAHFGQPSTWPRGLPLGAAAAPLPAAARGARRAPAVQQGLADGDPDVDAVFRLTRKPAARRIDFSFAQAPPVALPRGAFAPWNAQNTVFTRDALWALVLPQSVEFRVCDIWRAYWATRLLWGIGARVAFVAPYVRQLRNAHDYQGDYESEAQIYAQAGPLIDFLGAWACAEGGARALRACALQLARDMAAAGFWAPSDAELVRHFHHDLARAGYEFPEWRDAPGATARAPPRGGGAEPGDGALARDGGGGRETTALLGRGGGEVPGEGGVE